MLPLLPLGWHLLAASLLCCSYVSRQELILCQQCVLCVPMVRTLRRQMLHVGSAAAFSDPCHIAAASGRCVGILLMCKYVVALPLVL